MTFAAHDECSVRLLVNSMMSAGAEAERMPQTRDFLGVDDSAPGTPNRVDPLLSVVPSRWLDCDAVVMLTLVSHRSDGSRIGNHVSATNPTVPAFSGPTDLVTAIAQDANTGQVLMVAHMNREAWEETLRTGRAVYFSRTRGRLWRKGEESGNFQNVREIFVDCDGDAVLLKVEQVGGAACHEGYPSCFFRQLTPDGMKIIAERMFDPAKVYNQSN